MDHSRTPANLPDRWKVAVWFGDDLVGLLFADLLESHGVEAYLLGSDVPPPRFDGLVTERRGVGAVPDVTPCRTIVVGSSGPDGVPAGCVRLEQPLTERSIDDALAALLSRMAGSHAPADPPSGG